MRRPFLLKIIIIIMLITSCHTLTDEEYAQSIINRAYPLEGEEAASVYLEGLKNIQSPELYYNLAYSYLEAGEYDKAIQAASDALLHYPGRLRFMYLRAYAYKAQGRYYTYEKALKTILIYDPGNDDIRNMLLDHYIATGRKKEAAEIAEDVIKRNPTDRKAQSALAYSSPFFRAIAPVEEKKTVQDKESWHREFTLFNPLEILRGTRLLSDEKTDSSSDAASSSL